VIDENAVGIDHAIALIQGRLAGGLTWVEKIFGRCVIQHEFMKVTTDRGVQNKENIFPQFYTKTSEPYNLMPNDNLKSSCFFIAHDPGSFVSYDPFKTQQYISRNISIVFWYNCLKVKPDTKGPFNEELILSVLQAMKMYSNFEFSEVIEEYNNVMKEFTITENMRQYMKFPYSAFRIDGKITFPIYAENCE